MATYSWSVPTGNIITGNTYIKDTDNKIQDTMDDLADFVNSSGAYTGQGLMFDYVNKASNQTITGVKTFSNGLIGNITGNITGNADTATKWTTSRSITLSGDVTGTVSGVDGSSSISIATSFALAKIVTGMIIMWSGSQASIPSGWLLCNGLNGTPNLIDRFIIGAGNNYAVGATGGSKDATLVSHTHTATSTAAGAHSHNYTRTDYSTSATDYQFSGSYSLSQTTQATSAVGDHNHTISVDTVGSSAANANLPPYYALCFIMKA